MSQVSQSSVGKTNIAVLIDGDNAQPALFEKILLEIARYGRPTIRRIYGDWTTSNMNGWKQCLHSHAVTPVQQFRNTVGKNATDSALIIDAMDILYSQSVRCFCIVSSDSDFTRLATRIREDGVKVIGIGRGNTPKAFINACDVFIGTENLEAGEDDVITESTPATKVASKPEASAPVDQAKKTVMKPATSPKTPTVKKRQPPDIEMLKKAFKMSVQDDGWAHLGAMGDKLRQIDPAFDPRTWGYSQLSQLVAAANSDFTIKKPDGPGAGGPYVSAKVVKTAAGRKKS